MPDSKVHLPNKPIQNSQNESTHDSSGHHPQQCTPNPLANTLVLVAFIVEHCERNNEEDKHGVDDVNDEPQGLHREREVARTIVDRVATRLPVRDICREHENGDCGDRETENDDEFGEVCLVLVIRMLVVHEKVHVHQEHDHAHHDRHDQQSKVEIPHCRPMIPFFLSFDSRLSFCLFFFFMKEVFWGFESEENGEFGDLGLGFREKGSWWWIGGRRIEENGEEHCLFVIFLVPVGGFEMVEMELLFDHARVDGYH